MASDTEPAKLLLPYLQRADELQQHEPLVAYYCRLYAMERGLKIPQNQRTKTTNALLISLMKQLEKDKKSLKLGPDDHLHLEGFALNVFAKADKQDRAGKADINTAKTFYAASLFFEILNQFGELQSDLEQKQKYAVWKAADIRKALKEGRKPVPGPPGGEADFSISSSTPSGYDLEPSNHTDDTNYGLEPDSTLSHEYEDDKMKRQPSVNLSSPPPTFPSNNYSTQDYNSPHTTGGLENRSYSQQYHQPTYPEEPPPPPQQHIPQNNYPSHEIPPSYSYPNFQSYPSFSETALPTASPHYSSYYQGHDASYPHQPPQSTMNYPSGPSSTSGNTPEPPPASPRQPPQPAMNYPSGPSATYNSSSMKGSGVEPPPASTQNYHYDSNYQPPPEKIAEAHKAARFAVGALAFDDVSIAVDFLKKSLELLTNPSAGQ